MNNTLSVLKRVVKVGAPDMICGKVLDLFYEFVKAEYNRYFPELRAISGEAMEDVPTGEAELLKIMKDVNKYETSEELQRLIKNVNSGSELDRLRRTKCEVSWKFLLERTTFLKCLQSESR